MNKEKNNGLATGGGRVGELGLGRIARDEGLVQGVGERGEGGWILVGVELMGELDVVGAEEGDFDTPAVDGYVG